MCYFTPLLCQWMDAKHLKQFPADRFLCCPSLANPAALHLASESKGAKHAHSHTQTRASPTGFWRFKHQKQFSTNKDNGLGFSPGPSQLAELRTTKVVRKRMHTQKGLKTVTREMEFNPVPYVRITQSACGSDENINSWANRVGSKFKWANMSKEDLKG